MFVGRRRNRVNLHPGVHDLLTMGADLLGAMSLGSRVQGRRGPNLPAGVAP